MQATPLYSVLTNSRALLPALLASILALIPLVWFIFSALRKRARRLSVRAAQQQILSWQLDENGVPMFASPAVEPVRLATRPDHARY